MRKRFSALVNLIRSKKRIAVIALLAILIIIFFFLHPRKDLTKEVQFAKVERGSIQETVTGSGILEGINEATLHFQSGGLLSFVNVSSGDHIHSGDVLAGLDTRSLSAAVTQAQNTYDARQADVDKVLDDIHLYQYGNGGQTNVGSTDETQTQRDQRISAQKARDSAYDALNQAKVALQNATLISPIDGVIASSDFLPGQNISPTDTIVKVVDFSRKVFKTDIDESEISKINLSQSASFTLNAYGDRVFYGSVTEISPTTHTTSDGATVISVKISADDPSIQNISGLGGTTTIITGQNPNALVIPQSALLSDNTVLVKTPQGFKSIKVTTGLSNDTQVEVLSGLSEGQEVITNPSVVKVNVSGSSK